MPRDRSVPSLQARGLQPAEVSAAHTSSCIYHPVLHDTRNSDSFTQAAATVLSLEVRTAERRREGVWGVCSPLHRCFNAVSCP